MPANIVASRAIPIIRKTFIVFLSSRDCFFLKVLTLCGCVALPSQTGTSGKKQLAREIYSESFYKVNMKSLPYVSNLTPTCDFGHTIDLVDKTTCCGQVPAQIARIFPLFTQATPRHWKAGNEP